MNIETKLTLFPAGSHASRSALPGSEKAKTMTVTSGLKCLEWSERLNRPTLLAKMLLGSSNWHSTRCYLTWRIKATPQKRLLYQLAVKTPGIDAIGYGLLLTPTTVELCEHPAMMRARAKRKGYKNSTKWNSISSQVNYGAHLFFPTPKASDGNSPGAHGQGGQDLRTVVAMMEGLYPTPTHTESFKTVKGTNQNSLTRMAIRGELLPTPTTQDAKNNGTQSQQERNSLPLNAVAGGKLNPEWIEWLMGYPVGWTDLRV